MKRHGLGRNYIYLLPDDELNLSDVISISQLIKYSDREKEKGLTEYYEILLGSLIESLELKYSIQDYIKTNFGDESLTRLIGGLFMVRKEQLNYIHCFSGDWVGNRWKMKDYETESAKMVKERVINYRENKEKFSLEVIEIDKTLAKLIDEDYSKVVLLSDILEKYKLSGYFEKIKDRYGEC